MLAVFARRPEIRERRRLDDVTSHMDGTYDADLYDFTTPELFLGDRDWYGRKARECGAPVLELGAGTGRIALALAREGIHVHALDVHAGMISALRRKLAAEPPDVRSRVVVVQEDMRTFRIESKFALVIAPFRALLHNLTEADHLATFERVRLHLRPGGRFAFNVFHPSLEFMSRHAGPLTGTWRWTDTYLRQDGGWIVRSDANRYDTVARRIHSLLRYEDFGADGVLKRTFMHRLELSYLYAEDVHRLLNQAGFRAVTIAGGSDGRPLQRDTDEMFVEASVD